MPIVHGVAASIQLKILDDPEYAGVAQMTSRIQASIKNSVSQSYLMFFLSALPEISLLASYIASRICVFVMEIF